MWWKALQLGTIYAVVASNIHWGWTPNPYVPALFGLFAAVILTAIIYWLLEGCRFVLSFIRSRQKLRRQ